MIRKIPDFQIHPFLKKCSKNGIFVAVPKGVDFSPGTVFGGSLKSASTVGTGNRVLGPKCQKTSVDSQFVILGRNLPCRVLM